MICSTFAFIMINTPVLIVCFEKYSPEWKLQCVVGVLDDPDCPVNGGWSNWGEWSPCQGPCDEVGRRTKVRECNNPPPSNGGAACEGFKIQNEICYQAHCDVESFKRLIAGDEIRTIAFQQLAMVPSLLKRCLTFECSYESIESLLKTENTWQLSPESLWNAVQCVKRNIGCQVNGEWDEWDPWSPCSALCGSGYRWRSRRCNSPPPSDARFWCEGQPLEAEPCVNDQCIIDERIQQNSALWGPWGEWTPCSQVCGIGIKRRRRVCLEKPRHKNDDTSVLGTTCRGSHDQVETCSNKKCFLNGEWSGWGHWTPCSKTCGPGKKTRARSCTRPVPTGGGKPCIGLHSETKTCNLRPCTSFTHNVATFNGMSNIYFARRNMKTSLFHAYIRFKPINMDSELLSRGKNPAVKISLRKWRVHVSIDVTPDEDDSNSILYSSQPLSPATWHSLMVAVTPQQATLWIDDYKTPIFTNVDYLEISDGNNDIWVGSTFAGQIQEIFINFTPMDLRLQKKRKVTQKVSPSAVTNVEYSTADLEEGFLTLSNGDYLRVPCFIEQNQWRIDLVFEIHSENGIILFSWNNASDSWLLLELVNKRLKVKAVTGDHASEVSSTEEFFIDNWLHLNLAKDKDKNVIHLNVNNGEIMHVSFDSKTSRRRQVRSQLRELTKDIFRNFIKPNSLLRDSLIANHVNSQASKPIPVCAGEFFIGGIPLDIMSELNITTIFPFAGTISTLSVNNVLQDLYSFDVERYKDDILQVSCRTASVSAYYFEAILGFTKNINLTCLHSKNNRSKKEAIWLYLNSAIPKVSENASLKLDNDGKTFRLISTDADTLKGFYTCRAYLNGRMANIVTYGVAHFKNLHWHKSNIMNYTAGTTALILTAFTILWLLKEGILDLKRGYGFFRDQCLPPDDEMKAIIKYIDLPENSKYYRSETEKEVAKERVRRIAIAKEENDRNIFREYEESLHKRTSSVQSSRKRKSRSRPRSKNNYEVYMGQEQNVDMFTPPIDHSNRQQPYGFKNFKASKGRSLIHQENESLLLNIPKSDRQRNVMSPAQMVLRKFYALKSDD